MVLQIVLSIVYWPRWPASSRPPPRGGEGKPLLRNQISFWGAGMAHDILDRQISATPWLFRLFWSAGFQVDLGQFDVPGASGLFLRFGMLSTVGRFRFCARPLRASCLTCIEAYWDKEKLLGLGPALAHAALRGVKEHRTRSILIRGSQPPSHLELRTTHTIISLDRSHCQRLCGGMSLCLASPQLTRNVVPATPESPVAHADGCHLNLCPHQVSPDPDCPRQRRRRPAQAPCVGSEVEA